MFENFYITGYEFTQNKLFLKYNFDKQVFFIEEIDFNVVGYQDDNKDKSSRWYLYNNKNIINFDKNVLNFLFSSILIANWISYYKLYPFAKIHLPIFLKPEQLNFWYKFYINGLWEFFFKNQINPNVVHFINNSDKEKTFLPPLEKPYFSNKSLLLRWGGKDSIVSSQLIKNFDLLVVGKLDPIKLDTAKVLWKTPILIKRKLDPALFSLNQQPWFFNWHVPITGIISFISVTTAYLYGYKAVYTSNEKSW